MNSLQPRQAPRHALGAEELLELGQSDPADQRLVFVSADEGRLMIKVVENIVSFIKNNAIEFHSYCPTSRWQDTLVQVGGWTQEIERQLKSGQTQVAVPAEAIFRLVDLEKCISAARDAKVSSTKYAFMLSAGGAIADVVFGLSWIGVPAYLGGLAILFGGPLKARLSAEPQEPFQKAISGSCRAGGAGPRLGDHTDKKKVLERVLVSEIPGVHDYHWGSVKTAPGGPQSAICLVRGRFRIRVEGWVNDQVEPHEGWEYGDEETCNQRQVEIAVWDTCEQGARVTPWGEVKKSSGHPETLFIDYVGPITGGISRTAGPFG